ncbi:hypothetical protein HYU14_06580 [Candidatus Woesearchaeota archaeon]|nr:hypothetical protein [Candidatus Woesearchaeota archaeon]
MSEVGKQVKALGLDASQFPHAYLMVMPEEQHTPHIALRVFNSPALEQNFVRLPHSKKNGSVAAFAFPWDASRDGSQDAARDAAFGANEGIDYLFAIQPRKGEKAGTISGIYLLMQSRSSAMGGPGVDIVERMRTLNTSYSDGRSIGATVSLGNAPQSPTLTDLLEHCFIAYSDGPIRLEQFAQGTKTDGQKVTYDKDRVVAAVSENSCWRSPKDILMIAGAQIPESQVNPNSRFVIIPTADGKGAYGTNGFYRKDLLERIEKFGRQ